jgi:hypothetical protein
MVGTFITIIVVIIIIITRSQAFHSLYLDSVYGSVVNYTGVG